MNTQNIQPFIVMDIVRRAAQYSDAIHFEIGQPDLSPAPAVKAAMQQAISASHYQYTESLGLPSLRSKIAAYYQNTYGIHIAPHRILLTPGTSGAFLIAYALAMPNGGTLGLTDPAYPCYQNFAHLLGITPALFPVNAANHYQLRPEQLENAAIHALQISSPANPTGNLYTPANLEALNRICLERGITFISDELYHGLTYGDPAASAIQYNDNAIVINGFSKTYCMPGARLGWMIVPENLARQAEIIAQNLYISAPTLSQYGALHAFDSAYVETCRAEFQRRRDYLYHALKDIFCIEYLPEGAFYLWADISQHSDDCYQFALQMLTDIHVAAAPGIDFGQNGTQKYLRFAYTRSIEHMAEGIERLKQWLC